MAVLEIIWEIADLFCSWRLYLCLGPALLGAFFLHASFPDASWPWFISIPIVITALCGGLYWDWRARRIW